MMTVYTYSEARQNLSSLLDTAAQGTEVVIKRRDGQMFALRPITEMRSALDVGSIDVSVSREDILDAIRESRMRFGEGKPSYITAKQKRRKARTVSK